MTLIGVSILTTYQHHFIDLPTGMAVGFLALWALPDEGESPLRHLALARDPKRRQVALLYALGVIALAAPAWLGGAWLWLLWPATALAFVALNYGFIGAAGFQKGRAGRLTLGARGLLAPYLAGARLNSRAWTRRRPESPVLDGVSIGRIPSSAGLSASPFVAVIDLCAELTCGRRDGLFYRSIPVLDLTVPDAASLRTAATAIEEARLQGPVLVCCALGYSRSAAAIVAWLLLTHRAPTVDAAVELLRRARPGIVLRREHREALASSFILHTPSLPSAAHLKG
jgi:protein-tyrosine phosphatase